MRHVHRLEEVARALDQDDDYDDRLDDSNQQTLNKVMSNQREQWAEERAIRAEDKRNKEKGARRLLEDAAQVNTARFSAEIIVFSR
ncbi:Protein CBG28134 [Caenorhabditis briggsae]|uniref:Uncharacterized protein n=2 Tax=Caenorhabditis briggsae TaxID=6238 RepID=A0AAE9FPW5_CAEBR|nr:Protein CBG28134 [Caenorhabditis briggsae]ULT85310.1 hypothetical protein L3Y34_013841 [Caenorhabditis briggsae]UMM44525.1 hypothetical protein L5515_019663 [Caenorhabditis briggsae]CAR99504.1 Protein CBG28134 [Caenorhabditis briggsae]